jgi:hypothetical protein
MRIIIDRPMQGYYVAAEEDWDLGWPTGLGRTQEEAIADLLSQRDLGPETLVEVV